MKVKARTNINYSGPLYRAGDVFEIADGDLEAMTGIADAVGEPAAPKAPEITEAPVKKPAATEEKKRPSRKRNA